MNSDYYNSEHYPQPTVYAALRHMEQEFYAFRPLVFICSPYAGDVDTNVVNARRYSRFAVKQGYLPIAPHLLFPQFMNDENPEERALALYLGKVLMSKCAEVWVFGDHISPGMASEIKRARLKHYPIRYFDSNCKEVTDHA